MRWLTPSRNVQRKAPQIGKEYGKEVVARAAGKAVSPLARELARAVGGEVTKSRGRSFRRTL